MPTKTLTPFSGQLVTFTTSISISMVLDRLDVELRREKAGALIQLLREPPATQDAFKAALGELTEGRGFLFFLQMEHTPWMRLYEPKTSQTVVYTIGNPVIAQSIMRHDLRAAYNIPPRLLIKERTTGLGTEIIYHLPSSVMVLTENDQLLQAAVALDRKLEDLVSRVTDEGTQGGDAKE